MSWGVPAGYVGSPWSRPLAHAAWSTSGQGNVESFNGKSRDACLNGHWFLDLADARRTIEAWGVHYNTVRPHSSLGFLTPEQFRAAGDGGCGPKFGGRSATCHH